MKRILVAEDNDSNYLLMTFILKGHYEYFRACNGQEAVDKASTEHPDMILMDLKMPKMDGLTATKQIKGMLPNLPIVALTANAFTRNGWTFLGWAESATATTVKYTNGQSVKNLATSGTKNLYAVWDP